MSLKRLILPLVPIVAIGFGAFFYFLDYGEEEAEIAENGPLVEVVVPEALSPEARRGEEIFNANCSVCHGAFAAGRNGLGPPLVHPIYEPDHHGDESFQLAVARGTRAHHWPFGDMLPVEGLDRNDVRGIIAFVRELQRASGIR